MQQIAPEIKQLATNLRAGQHKKQCPQCQDDRSKNRKDRPLSIRVDGTGVKYRCHHCGVEGGWVYDNDSDFDIPEVLPSKPIALINRNGNDEAFEYLRSRHIAEEVIKNYTILSTYRFSGGRLTALRTSAKKMYVRIFIIWMLTSMAMTSSSVRVSSTLVLG